MFSFSESSGNEIVWNLKKYLPIYLFILFVGIASCYKTISLYEKFISHMDTIYANLEEKAEKIRSGEIDLSKEAYANLLIVSSKRNMEIYMVKNQMLMILFLILMINCSLMWYTYKRD